MNFYCPCVWSILEYCLPVFQRALSYDNPRRTLRRAQNRTLHIITPECTHEDNLSRFNLSSLGIRRDAACSKGRTIVFLKGGGEGGLENFYMQTFFLNGSLLQTIFNGPSLSYLMYMYIPSHRLLHLVPQIHEHKKITSGGQVPLMFLFVVPIVSGNPFYLLL